MKTFIVNQGGIRVPIYHNLPDKRIENLFKKWAWGTGQIKAESFCEYSNSLIINKIMNWKSEI